MDLCLSLRTVGADEALAIGLVDTVVEDPLANALEYATAVAALDHSAVAAVKKVIAVGSVDDALEAERSHNSAWGGEVTRP